jgi:hypothetical protein
VGALRLALSQSKFEGTEAARRTIWRVSKQDAFPMNRKGDHMRKMNLNAFPTVRPAARRLGGLLAVAALVFGLNSIAAAAENKGCSDATLIGDYGFTIQGYSPNPDGTQSPIRGVAITHFDGAGKLTQRDFVITAGLPNVGNGNAETGFVFSTGETGSYALNSDCTGTAEIDLNVPVPFGSKGVIKLMLVVTNDGRAIHTVVSELTSPGATAPSLVTTSSDAWKIDSDHDHR